MLLINSVPVSEFHCRLCSLTRSIEHLILQSIELVSHRSLYCGNCKAFVTTQSLPRWRQYYHHQHFKCSFIIGYFCFNGLNHSTHTKLNFLQSKSFRFKFNVRLFFFADTFCPIRRHIAVRWKNVVFSPVFILILSNTGSFKEHKHGNISFNCFHVG